MSHSAIIILVIVIVFIAFNVAAKSLNAKTKQVYTYTRKRFFMSAAERECFTALTKAIDDRYLIFAQVHLPTLLENKVVGQHWRGAFRHIDEKSVDFVLCEPIYISPILVIELDDKTHERADRKVRDSEVERILQEAGLPLLRLENHGSFDSTAIANQIQEKLKEI